MKNRKWDAGLVPLDSHRNSTQNRVIGTSVALIWTLFAQCFSRKICISVQNLIGLRPEHMKPGAVICAQDPFYDPPSQQHSRRHPIKTRPETKYALKS